MAVSTASILHTVPVINVANIVSPNMTKINSNFEGAPVYMSTSDQEIGQSEKSNESNYESLSCSEYEKSHCHSEAKVLSSILSFKTLFVPINDDTTSRCIEQMFSSHHKHDIEEFWNKCDMRYVDRNTLITYVHKKHPAQHIQCSEKMYAKKKNITSGTLSSGVLYAPVVKACFYHMDKAGDILNSTTHAIFYVSWEYISSMMTKDRFFYQNFNNQFKSMIETIKSNMFSVQIICSYNHDQPNLVITIDQMLTNMKMLFLCYDRRIVDFNFSFSPSIVCKMNDRTEEKASKNVDMSVMKMYRLIIDGLVKSSSKSCKQSIPVEVNLSNIIKESCAYIYMGGKDLYRNGVYSRHRSLLAFSNQYLNFYDKMSRIDLSDNDARNNTLLPGPLYFINMWNYLIDNIVENMTVFDIENDSRYDYTDDSFVRKRVASHMNKHHRFRLKTQSLYNTINAAYLLQLKFDLLKYTKLKNIDDLSCLNSVQWTRMEDVVSFCRDLSKCMSISSFSHFLTKNFENGAFGNNNNSNNNNFTYNNGDINNNSSNNNMITSDNSKTFIQHDASNEEIFNSMYMIVISVFNDMNKIKMSLYDHFKESRESYDTVSKIVIPFDWSLFFLRLFFVMSNSISSLFSNLDEHFVVDMSNFVNFTSPDCISEQQFSNHDFECWKDIVAHQTPSSNMSTVITLETNVDNNDNLECGQNNMKASKQLKKKNNKSVKQSRKNQNKMLKNADEEEYDCAYSKNFDSSDEEYTSSRPRRSKRKRNYRYM